MGESINEVISMELKDLLTLYFERSNAMQMYWNFYITIILALLAFFGTVKLSSKAKLIALAAVLTVAFGAFASVNLEAVRWVHKQRYDAKALIDKGAFYKNDDLVQETARQLAKHLNTPSLSTVTALHLTGDVLAIAGIWVLMFIKKQNLKVERSS